MPKARAWKIDSTPHSAVVVCQHTGCQWRGITHTKPSAYRLVAAHLRRVHRDKNASANAAAYAENYHRTSRSDTDDAKVSA